VKVYNISLTFPNGNKVSGPGFGETPAEATEEFIGRQEISNVQLATKDARLAPDQAGMRADLIGRTEGF
jgi:hypothetical protein